MGEETEIYTKTFKHNAFLWLYSAIAAFINGGAVSAVAMFVKPEDFNLNAGLKDLGKLFLGAGIVGLFLYLKQSPLPKLPEETK
jgi:hypothetical protein